MKSICSTVLLTTKVRDFVRQSIVFISIPNMVMSYLKNGGLFASLTFSKPVLQGFKYEDDANNVEQEYLISDFLAPAFITAAVGFEYHPVEYFKLRSVAILCLVLPLCRIQHALRRASVHSPTASIQPRLPGPRWQRFKQSQNFRKTSLKMNLKWRYMMYANYETLTLIRSIIVLISRSPVK